MDDVRRDEPSGDRSAPDAANWTDNPFLEPDSGVGLPPLGVKVGRVRAVKVGHVRGADPR